MLSELLAKARALIAGGWVPLISRDASGAMCDHLDEGIARFCIVDALLAASPGDEKAMHQGARALGIRIEPVKLGDWEGAPERTHADVLQLFARAHKHALAKESR